MLSIYIPAAVYSRRNAVYHAEQRARCVGTRPFPQDRALSVSGYGACVFVCLCVGVRVCVCEDIIVVEERQYGRRLQSVDGGGSSVSRFSLLCCCLSSALCAYVFVEG